MDHPKKERASTESKVKFLMDIDEVKELAKAIVEVDKARLKELDDPLDFYAQEMKIRWHHDVKSFSKRLIEGYGVLLEQLATIDQNDSKEKNL